MFLYITVPQLWWSGWKWFSQSMFQTPKKISWLPNHLLFLLPQSVSLPAAAYRGGHVVEHLLHGIFNIALALLTRVSTRRWWWGWLHATENGCQSSLCRHVTLPMNQGAMVLAWGWQLKCASICTHTTVCYTKVLQALSWRICDISIHAISVCILIYNILCVDI